MLEVEIKALCSEPDSMKEKVLSLGGERIESRIDRDLYFNHPARNFAETDEAVRIRSIGDRHFLTYKGPKLSTQTKSRVEEEVTVGDAHTCENILAALGFSEVLLVVKKRELFELEEVELCIDTIEGLGSFVELEIQTDDQAKGEARLFELAAQLGLGEFINRSYLEMLLEKEQG